MIEPLPPSLVLLLGAFLLPLVPGRAKLALLPALPVLGLWNMWSLAPGTQFTMQFLGYSLVFGQVDKTALLFGTVFHLVALFGGLFLWSFRRNLEFTGGFFYAGAAVGVVFAGDWLTFFAFWEMLTLGALGLILARGTRRAEAAAFRYALFHVAGGLLLLAGIALHVRETGGAALESMALEGPAAWLILFGMGVNAAFPLLHTWVVDAYPEASIGGAVFLAALTTKTAVYALWRVFPGAEPLVFVGAVMALFPILYAVLETDMRRLLSYIIINQVGFMVAGVGLGSELSLNGAAAHAFSHILYDAVLFMALGAVMLRTGTAAFPYLGGLFRSMPATAVFCMVGAASISSVPFTNGFISKSMVLSAAAEAHRTWLWLALLAASAGVFLTAGLKLVVFTFFGKAKDLGSGAVLAREAPWNMLAAMAATAALCLSTGMFPSLLYRHLPFPVEYAPYTVDHLLTQLQLLAFVGLAFYLALRWGWWPAASRGISLDSDWLYRRGLRSAVLLLWSVALNPLGRALAGAGRAWAAVIRSAGGAALRAILEGLWLLCGLPEAQKAARRQNALDNLRDARLPVGLGAALALILILALFAF